MRLCGQAFENRGRRTDEAIQVLRLLWSGDISQAQGFEGEHYSFRDVYCNPKPARGTIPIHVGGSSVAAARRAGRYGDGFQPLNLDPAQLAARLDVMRTAAADSGRDPAALEVTVRRPMAAVTEKTLQADARAGITRLVVSGSLTSDLTQAVDEISAFAERAVLS
jgi:alkanesulfonate monooxygenase SsuD/methylene tetrahydromethanopterin reductase-like flavin-dependent oxidoreductase (luciferase family)